MTNDFWVITEGVNDYNQYGEYLVCVFNREPSVEEIISVIDCSTTNAMTLSTLNVNGVRIGDSWYYLTKLNHGEKYEGKTDDK